MDKGGYGSAWYALSNGSSHQITCGLLLLFLKLHGYMKNCSAGILVLCCSAGVLSSGTAFTSPGGLGSCSARPRRLPVQAQAVPRRSCRLFIDMKSVVCSLFFTISGVAPK